MSSPQQQEFEDDYDWTEKFIQTIQTRSPLYNNALAEHSDRILISRLWNEVCETMYTTWHDMTAYEKFAKAKELQNRWRNLRTCFRREMNKQKQETSGPAAKRRRKYVYFDQLLFLLPVLQDRPTVNESSPPAMGDNSESEIDNQAVQTSGDHTFQDTIQQVRRPSRDEGIQRIDYSQGNTSQASTSVHVRKSVRKKSRVRIEKTQTLLPNLQEKTEEEIDEDKFFLLSLLPSFKKLNNVQKFDAKIEFLGTLRRLIRVNQECRYLNSERYENYTSQKSPSQYQSSRSSTPTTMNHDLIENNFNIKTE